MKSKRMERQMNKEQAADDPSVDLIHYKKLYAPFLWVTLML